MCKPSDAYNGLCPRCEHKFSLADLKSMAIGDGWQRYIRARVSAGEVQVISFDDFDPAYMVAIYDEAPKNGEPSV